MLTVGLKRVTKPVRARVEPVHPVLSQAAKEAMIFFLSSGDEELNLRSARAVVRARHGLTVEQEIRSFVAGLAVKSPTHKVTPIPGEHTRFRVESLSAPGEHYDVCIADFQCPCKGWSVRKWCSHLDDAIGCFRARRNVETMRTEHS